MPDKERYTIPVINIIQHNREYMQEYMKRTHGEKHGLYEYFALHKNKMDQTIVEAHKKIFGKQSYCWTGEYRYWVWDFGKWRVYVSDKKGIQIEVEPDVEIEETMSILRGYWQKFGS